MSQKSIIIVGGGPAGLRAAEILAQGGFAVTIYERKPSLGRKFLMAGRGGLNLTHSEPLDKFMARYGPAREKLAGAIDKFTPENLRQWCEELGQETFVGSSGRIFPKAMKASPLLRAWIARLNTLGIQFKMGRIWRGWNNKGELVFETDGKTETAKADAVLLALGGASWPGLGSDGAWVSILKDKHIDIAPLRPANCGFIIEWSDIFQKFAGTPIKNIKLTHNDVTAPGELMISANGIEGGAIYALSSHIRDAIDADGEATVTIDLSPNLSHDDLKKKLSIPRARNSFSTYIKKATGFPPVTLSLLREIKRDVQDLTVDDLAKLIKALPLTLIAPFPIDRAISTAGGVKFSALDENYMLKNLPGVFAAGEMLDWEAPTGGYLLQATFATGTAAAAGIAAWLKKN